MESKKVETMVAEDIFCFARIFSAETRKRIIRNVKFLKVIYDDNFEDPEYGRDSLAVTGTHILNSGMKKGCVSLVVLSVSSRTHRNVRIHELWHALMFDLDVKKRGNAYLSHGVMKFEFLPDGRCNKTNSGLEEGCAEFFSKLAIITESAKKSDGSYSRDILNNADHYLKTGEVVCGNQVIMQGYYKSLEDVVRLLIMASRNDFGMLNISNLLGRVDEVGIDCRIGDDNYSQFIDSAVNSNFLFHDEFDRVLNGRGLSFEHVNSILDDIVEYVMRSGGRLNDKLQNDLFMVIDSIKRYYLFKLNDAVVKKRIITDEDGRRLYKEFDDMCSSVLRRHCSNVFGGGEDSRRISFQR